MLIVLVSGKKRSGKDYISGKIADELSNTYSCKPEIISFASPIKHIISDTLEINLTDLESIKDKGDIFVCDKNSGSKLSATTMRRVLQRFGTEAMKSVFGKDIWMSVFVDKVSKIENSRVVIVPDFRFISEYNYIRGNNYQTLTLRIKNDDIVTTDIHPSETELDTFDFDYIINNTGHIDNSSMIKSICENIMKQVV